MKLTERRIPRNPDESELDPATREKLKGATGIWFTGGDQSRITSALDGTELLATIRRRNLQGVPIGGTSAGASIPGGSVTSGGRRLNVRTSGDFETLEDNAVTIRERDSMAQERVALDQVEGYLAQRLLGC